ncbi:MAG TPA: JAB domain-containing protein [Daejeonella sp.]|nr:JAB domain-containing protein [Daejeonella sp.]
MKPSQADLELTRKLKSAGQFLDIPVLDHLIITDHGFLSFADEGLLD